VDDHLGSSGFESEDQYDTNPFPDRKDPKLYLDSDEDTKFHELERVNKPLNDDMEDDQKEIHRHFLQDDPNEELHHDSEMHIPEDYSENTKPLPKKKFHPEIPHDGTKKNPMEEHESEKSPSLPEDDGFDTEELEKEESGHLHHEKEDLNDEVEGHNEMKFLPITKSQDDEDTDIAHEQQAEKSPLPKQKDIKNTKDRNPAPSDGPKKPVEMNEESTQKVQEKSKSQTQIKVNSKVLAKAIEFLENEYDATVSLIPKVLHQQYSSEANVPSRLRQNMENFKYNNAEYLYLFWGDEDLDEFVKHYHPFLYGLYKKLPMPVLRSDLARYMLLYTFGGVYSDLDTVPIRKLSDWSDGHQKNVGLLVGIEVDTDRSDWEDWYPRSLGFCQWTMAAQPGHPVLAKTIFDASRKLKETPKVTEKDVVHLTGPAVWTDAVLSYLNELDVGEKQLRGLEHSTLHGDVYVLPITAFSPGVGHMGDKGLTDKEARVEHQFDGSWKKQRG
jgi:alpha 1,6-mannosyltransferase